MLDRPAKEGPGRCAFPLVQDIVIPPLQTTQGFRGAGAGLSHVHAQLADVGV